MRKVNVRLVIILVVSTMVAAVVIFALHAFQFRRHADFFRQQAHEARQKADEILEEEAQQEQLLAAAGFFQRYIQLQPNDTDALVDYGILLLDLKDFGRAMAVLEKAVRLDPARSDARRKLTEMFMAIGRRSDAREHLEDFLLDEAPQDAELLDMLGVCQMADREYDAAAKSFEAAITNEPDAIQVYPHLAGLLRRHLNDKKKADEWMDKMVESNADNSKAYVLRGQYRKANDAPDKATEDANKALELAPNDEDALLLRAECALAQGENEEAREYAGRAIELYPKADRAYVTMSNLETLAKNREKAVQWLRKGLAANERSLQLHWSMAHFLIEDNRLDEANEVIDRLREGGCAPPLVGYLRARMDYKQRNWLAARRGFEQIRQDLLLIGRPDLAKSGDYLTAKCYEQLGNVEETVRTMKQAVAVDKEWGPGRSGLARALIRAGRIQEALKEYQRIMSMPDAPPQGWIDMARLLMAQNMRLPEDQRDWAPVEEKLDKAARALPDAEMIPILRSEILRAKNRPEEAKKLLVDARDKNPEKFAFWNALITTALRDKNWDEAEKLLKGAEAQFGDTAQVRVLRGRYLVVRGGPDAGEKIGKLLQGTEGFSKSDLLLLTHSVASLAHQAGNEALANELTTKMAKENPDDLQLRLMLFDTASRKGDEAAMKRLLKEIRQIEEEGPIWHYSQAVYLVRQYKPGNEDVLDKALKHLSQARVRRPKWGRVPLLAARIYDQQGDMEAAIEYYHQALDNGERNPEAIRRLVALLFRQQRYEEADQAITLLKESDADMPAELRRMWAEIKLLREDYDTALEMAQKVAEGSQEPRDHVWLGQILALLGERAKKEGNTTAAKSLFEEAEKSLTRGVQFAKGAPEPWVSLIRFLGQTGQTEKAERAIGEAKHKIAADKAPLALAECYEALGDYAKAAAQYQTVLATAPNNVKALRQVADFHLRRNSLQVAESLLRRIMSDQAKASTPDLVWARRRLALLLFTRGGYQNHVKALELIDKNLALNLSSIYDQRVKARILASHSTRKQREEAIKTLEKMLKEGQSGTSEDRYILSRLYLAEGNWSKASEQMRVLLADRGNNPKYVETYIRDLIQRGEGRDAGIWLEKLKELAPKQFVTSNLAAQVEAERGEFGRSIETLKQFVDEPDTRPLNKSARILLAAKTLETIGKRLSRTNQSAALQFKREAEGMYRHYIEMEPDKELQLAAFLGRQSRRDEALEVAESAWEKANPVPIASTCVALLGADGATEDQIERAERILDAALKKHDNAAPLLLAKAELRAQQKRDKESEALYRKVLERNERNVVALNNLAVFLALRKAKLDEALELMNKAIEIAGPVSTLLDSRATVLIAMRRWESAIDDLEEAIGDQPRALRFFHLAQAYHGYGDVHSAINAMKEAQRLGLDPADLQKAEAKAYGQLLRELKLKPT